MKISTARLRFAVVPLFALCFVAGVASAQSPLVSNSQSTPLSLIGQESLTLACTPTAGVTFPNTPLGSTVSGDNPVSCDVTWNLSATRTNLTLFSGFADPTTALANGANLIPSSAVSVSWNGGAAVPCTTTPSASGTGIAAGGGCGDSGNLLSTNFNSTSTETLALSLNLPATLNAGTYSGTLLEIAVAQ